MPRKTFKVGAAEPDEPIEFELAWEDGDGKPQTRIFRCVGDLRGGALVDVNEATNETEACVTIIRGALVADDIDAFDRLIRSPDVVVTGGQLADVFNWLLEVYGRGPFGKSPGSSDGGGAIDATSPEGSSKE